MQAEETINEWLRAAAAAHMHQHSKTKSNSSRYNNKNV